MRPSPSSKPSQGRDFYLLRSWCDGSKGWMSPGNAVSGPKGCKMNRLRVRGCCGVLGEGQPGVAKSWVPCAGKLPLPPVVFAPFSNKLVLSLWFLVPPGG